MGVLGLFLSRRGRRVLLLVALSVMASAAVAWTFVWPPSGNSGAADAVVMFQGGEGERLAEVQSLLDAGQAGGVAIIPEGHLLAVPGLCGDHDGYRVICGTPAVANTAGEAAFAAAIAHREGFDTLVVVTSSYHSTRAVIELERCFDGRVEQRPARPDLSVATWAGRITHEGVWLFQSLFRVGCVSPGWLLDGSPAAG